MLIVLSKKKCRSARRSRRGGAKQGPRWFWPRRWLTLVAVVAVLQLFARPFCSLPSPLIAPASGRRPPRAPHGHARRKVPAAYPGGPPIGAPHARRRGRPEASPEVRPAIGAAPGAATPGRAHHRMVRMHMDVNGRSDRLLDLAAARAKRDRPLLARDGHVVGRHGSDLERAIMPPLFLPFAAGNARAGPRRHVRGAGRPEASL